MRTYEGLFIFSDKFNDEELANSVAYVKTEIEKLGGKIAGSEALGRRVFCRPLRKQEAGHYIRVTFDMSPENVAPLRARYRLAENVFRVQVTHAEVRAPVKAQAVPAAAETNVAVV